MANGMTRNFSAFYPACLLYASILLSCSSTKPNPWDTGFLRPTNEENWQNLDSGFTEIPDSLAPKYSEKLSDQAAVELDSQGRRELGIPKSGSTLYLLRGLRIGRDRYCVEVFKNPEEKSVYVRQSTSEPEIYFPFLGPDTTFLRPVIVALEFEPKKVFVHATKGGDRIFRSRRCSERILRRREWR